MLTERVSLRLDTYAQWDGSTLVLFRTGRTPFSDGTIPAYGIDARSIDEAVEDLRDVAAAGDTSELFHVWPINTRAVLGLAAVRSLIRRVDLK